MRDIECPSGKVWLGCALPVLRLQPGSTARQEEGTAGRGAGARGGSDSLLCRPLPSSQWVLGAARGERRGERSRGQPLPKFLSPPKKKQSRQQPRISGISGQASRQQSPRCRSENSLQGTQTRAGAEAVFCRWSLLSLQYLGRRDMTAGTLPSWFLSVGSPAPQGTGGQTVSPRLPTASRRPLWLLAAGLGFGVCSETATSGSLTCCKDF